MNLQVWSLLEILVQHPHYRALVLRHRRSGGQLFLKKGEPLPDRADKREWMLLAVID
jgi:hypothetical protein